MGLPNPDILRECKRGTYNVHDILSLEIVFEGYIIPLIPFNEVCLSHSLKSNLKVYSAVVNVWTVHLYYNFVDSKMCLNLKPKALKWLKNIRIAYILLRI